MPAITVLTIHALAPVVRRLRTGARLAGRVLRLLGHSLKNRQAAGRLAGLDDRMLADIGLTRSDLRDAYAEPLWHDPTAVLARRAAERRSGRLRSHAVDAREPCRRPAAADAKSLCYPPTDRPVRYLM
jgi:uncharacterized protein YjiS (DUF1127 family)